MDIDEVVATIREQEEEREAAAAAVREQLDDTGNGVPFRHSVSPATPDDISVGGVDGGLAREAFHGLDIVMTRAVAAVFSYTDGGLGEAEYRPDPSPAPSVETVSGGVEREAVDRLATLQRLEAEIAAARAVVEDVDVLLLDGSLVPQPRDRPDDDSPLADTYEDVIDRYKDLYSAAAANETVLAGVVEDSRSAHLASSLTDHGVDGSSIPDMRDTVLLSYLLDAGERTVAVRYSDRATPVLEDIGIAPDDIGVFYLATARNDRPVRIELYRYAEHEVDSVAATLLGLSGGDRSYAVPPVLVEADQRAKLERQDIELVTKRVRAKLAHQPGVAELRRDRRPF
ncbi:MAG: DNA double-strand break repair nuclease NurA [Candidatus Nanohaloarchaea archaeon]|nr:DNA double-strand break repair nuclease NurA [Candidatus Nanohaloarchaea archaeon]